MRVKPGGRRGVLLGAYGGALKLEVSAPPEHGRANAAVMRLLADTFGVTPSDVSLVSGAAGRNKVVELTGCSPDAVVAALAARGIDAALG